MHTFSEYLSHSLAPFDALSFDNEKFIETNFEQDLILLKRIIAEQVLKLLKNDFEKLVNIAYRLDLSETKFNDCLTDRNLENASNHIAELIIVRQLEKWKTRNAYKQS